MLGREIRGAMRGGRGAYHKSMYAGRGRGRRSDNSPTHAVVPEQNLIDLGDGPPSLGRISGSGEDLNRELNRIDGKQYGAYKDLKGVWDFGLFTLCLDRIQSDPYAPPSKARIRVPQSIAKFPHDLFNEKSRNVALADYITRQTHQVITSRSYHIAQTSGHWSGAKGGDFQIDSPGQEILQRSSVLINSDWVEARISIGLPARGRTILGRLAAEIFTKSVPYVIEHSLLFSAYDAVLTKAFVECAEDQDHLRAAIQHDKVVAFIPNGAILPRQSGASDKPLSQSKAIPFRSPPTLTRTYTLPNRGAITGMAIPAGITTVVGGGFHGKSTLLQAISLGVWNHIPGDGREFVVTNPTAIGVRSEDGRSIAGVNISPFIGDLPGGTKTNKWSSEDASGSTSMAAGVVEACELGSQLLLFDEDLCATNFMIRDDVMRTLVKSEPITPLIERIRGLFQDRGVSSILVVGGCSDYLIADTVIMMEDYIARDVTSEAHELIKKGSIAELESHFPEVGDRHVCPRSFCNIQERPPKPRSRNIIQMSKDPAEDLDLSALCQIVHVSQSRLIARALYHLSSKRGDNTALFAMVDKWIARWEESMLNGDGEEEGWLASVRAIDLGMAINRIRGLKVA